MVQALQRLSSSRRSPNQCLPSSTPAIRSNLFKCPTSNEHPPNILRSPSLPTPPPYLKSYFVSIALISFHCFLVNQDSTRSSLNPIIHFLFVDFDRPETNQGAETFIPEEVSLAGMLNILLSNSGFFILLLRSFYDISFNTRRKKIERRHSM